MNHGKEGGGGGGENWEWRGMEGIPLLCTLSGRAHMAAATMGARWLQVTNNEDKELGGAEIVIVVVFWCKYMVTFFKSYLLFINLPRVPFQVKKGTEFPQPKYFKFINLK